MSKFTFIMNFFGFIRILCWFKQILLLMHIKDQLLYSIKWSFRIFIFFIFLIFVPLMIIFSFLLKYIFLFVLGLKNVLGFVMLIFSCIHFIIFLHNFRKWLTWIRNKSLSWLVSRWKPLIKIQACICDISYLFRIPVLLLLLWIIVAIIYFIVGMISFILIHPLLRLILLLFLLLLGIL